MKSILIGLLTAAMGLLMCSIGATIITWRYWAAMGICVALVIVSCQG